MSDNTVREINKKSTNSAKPTRNSNADALGKIQPEISGTTRDKNTETNGTDSTPYNYV